MEKENVLSNSLMDLSVSGSSKSLTPSRSKKVLSTNLSVSALPLEAEVVKSAVETSKEEDDGENFLVSKPARKNSGSLLVIGGDNGTAGATTSLQENFKRFRKQKVKERKIMQKCKEDMMTKGPRSQEYKDALRAKFIETAKKYIGKSPSYHSRYTTHH